jgi:hypothetical protein
MSRSSVPPEYLLHGAHYALEQCGLLIRDASFREGSYASNIVLSALAHEELERERILLGLRNKVISKQSVTIEDIIKACNPRVNKQGRSVLSEFLQAPPAIQIGKLIQMKLFHASNPQSPDYQEAGKRPVCTVW